MTGGVHEIAARRAIRQLSAADSPATGRPDLSIKRLGVARIDSPLAALLNTRQTSEHYVDESDRVILDDTLSMIRARDGSVDKLPASNRSDPDARSSLIPP